ncbi:MAG: V-type proton ATPase subunit E [Lachnospiraceae bacterium]|nr:V-type proton ATPase subunit E [Lachnospiraceae bacterium]
MIDATGKTNSFLKAIEKYAEEQKNLIQAETEAFKKEQLERANEEGTAAAYSYLQKEKAEYKAALAKKFSVKETELKRKLYEKRNGMVQAVFSEVEQQLRKYAKSSEYAAYMRSCAEELAEYMGENKSVVYISPNDKAFEPVITEFFGDKCEIVCDNTIKFGGMRCFCEVLSIVADKTLDSKLESEKSWFVANSGFTIE